MRATDGKNLTTEEGVQMEQGLLQAVALLTRAGVLYWDRAQQVRSSDFRADDQGAVTYEPSDHPMFVCQLNIQAGLLEETMTMPSLDTREPGEETVFETGMKLSLASFDEHDEEQGELVVDVGLELLATIERSIRERDEFLTVLQEQLNSRVQRPD